jgi:hypothetical protein
MSCYKKRRESLVENLLKRVPVLYLSMLSKRLGHDIKKKEKRRGKSGMREGEKWTRVLLGEKGLPP